MTPDPATGAARRWPTPSIVLLGGVLGGLYLLPVGMLAQAVIYQSAGVLATLLTLGGALSRPRGRRLPWLLISLGLLAQTVGDAIWNYVELVQQAEVAFPSLPDALYLAGYPLWTAGAALLVRRNGRGRVGAWLDTLILTGGVAAVGYHFLIKPYLTDSAVSVPERLVGAAYPGMDLLLFVATVLMVTASAARGRPALGLLTVAFACGFVGDVVYGLLQLHGIYESGHPIDLAWIIEYSLIASAAWAVPGPARSKASPAAPAAVAGWRVPALFVAAMAGPVELVLVVRADPAEAVVLAAGTVLLVGLVAVRLGLLLRTVSRQAGSLRETLTDRDAMASALQRQADEDALTGLANRHLLSRRAHELLATGTQAGHALLFVDLDGFRSVNERFGHPGGDALLRTVATRLRAGARDGELAARLGGDEFVVLLPDVTPDLAVGRAEELLRELAAPVLVTGRPVPVGVSIGVAPVHREGTPEQAFQTALSDADLAMFAAKQAGGGRVEAYHERLRDELLGAAELARELAEAIAADALDVAFQPLVDLQDSRLVAMEALVRWHHPVRGSLQPAGFLPLAMDRGLMDRLDLLVLRQGLAQLANWQDRHGASAPPRLNVNISAPLLARSDFVPTVQRLLECHGLPGSALALELTEQVLVDDPGTCAERLHELAALGVVIALDDFGTGYSSLAYLDRFPVHELKLDRTFIELGTAGGEASRLLCAVLELARTLGLTVVAEGIEDDRQRELLRRLGCELGQGYLFARPMAAEPAEQWFTRLQQGRRVRAASTSSRRA